MRVVWLVGAGGMAISYYNVLKHLNIDPLVVGRSQRSADEFYKATNHKPIIGGIEAALTNAYNSKQLPEYAIVSVSADQLYKVTKLLIQYSIKYILVEKPGAFYLNQLQDLDKNACENNVFVNIAYNRRFYDSVKMADNIINQDGGLLSSHIDFTEWSDKISVLDRSTEIKLNWFTGNSSHVIDLLIYFAGIPVKYDFYRSGSLDWHKSGSIYSGAGITDQGVLFSYHSNWQSAGRWSVSLLTNNYKILLEPMEELKLIKKNSIDVIPIKSESDFDNKFKPGILRMVSSWFDGDFDKFVSLTEQIRNLKIYKLMAGYEN